MKKIKFDISNLAKNCHETLILAALCKKEKHGYEIALEIEERSKGNFKFNYGTLYPTLHKLEKKKFIKGEWEDKSVKRKRKFYLITEKGLEYFDQQKDAWKEFINSIVSIMGDCE
ncbi:PadR family transcriptional regulator [candidate division KSB1 bacterium]